MTLFEPKKARARRNEIRGEVRRDRPGLVGKGRGVFASFRDERRLLTLGVALVFATLTASLLMLRPQVVQLRPGQVTNAPIFARSDFTVLDERTLANERQRAADAQPRVYRAAEQSPFAAIEDALLASPARVTGLRADQLGGEELAAVTAPAGGLLSVLGPGDGAISYGQAAVAAARLAEEEV